MDFDIGRDEIDEIFTVEEDIVIKSPQFIIRTNYLPILEAYFRA